MSHDTPLVSIITPTFNHERFIGRCIQSVLDQTYPHWELLIVNDGSTDRTLERCLECAGSDARIRVLDQENHGLMRLHETYNRALAAASGELVAILEGDDWWPLDKLAIQVGHHVTNAELLLSHGKVLRSDGDHIFGEYARPPLEGRQPALQYLRFLLLKEACFMPVSVIIRRDALVRIGGFQGYPGFPAVDLPTFRDLVQLPGEVMWIDHVLGFWRQSATQATSTVFTPEVDLTTLRLVIDCYRSLSGSTVKSLNLTEEDVQRAIYRKAVVPGLVGAFRKTLRTRNRREALKFAGEILKLGSARNRLFVLLGLCAMAVNRDLEGLYRQNLS